MQNDKITDDLSAYPINASHWGVFRAKTEKGRITEIIPFERDPDPSHCLPGLLDLVYSPSRIKYPAIRAGYLEKGIHSDPSQRGSEKFIRVSWEEATDIMTREISRVMNDYGGNAVFAGSYGWKSTGKLNACPVLLKRYLNLFGKGYVDTTGSYSSAGIRAIMPYILGTTEVDKRQTAWPVIVSHTDLVVLWAADPLLTAPIGWMVPDHASHKGFEALKKSGKKVIVIDPVKNMSADYFNAEWIAPRPHTDVAMMLGIAHTLYSENLYDEDFIKTYTYGFERFLSYLIGETDHIAKTAEWAAQICGVPADILKKLAFEFASKRTMLMSGWSIQRQHHGEQPHWMLITLAAMLGQIGLPGGGFGFAYHYSGGGNPVTDCPVLPGITAGNRAVNAGSAVIPVARIVDMLENPGKTIDFDGKRVTYPDIRLAYWAGGNPFSHHQDRNRQIRAWQKLETFIVQDIVWTPTARMADIVLPAATTFERNDIDQWGGVESIRGIVAQKKIIDPLYESRSDYDIFRMLAAQIGKEAEFTEGKESELDWICSFYEEAANRYRDKTGGIMPSFKEFWEKGYIEFEEREDAGEFTRYADFRRDPVRNGLKTPSGKIEIFSETIEAMNYEDCPPHPAWLEPLERCHDAPFSSAYPLHIVSKHSYWRLHSQLCSTHLRDHYVVNGRAPVTINPKDAAKRNIKNGDIIRVFNDRGQILAGAVISDMIREGAIICEEGNWYAPMNSAEENTLCLFGDPNVLTPDIGTSKLGQGNCGHTGMAEVEKYEKDAPQVNIFNDPAD